MNIESGGPSAGKGGGGVVYGCDIRAGGGDHSRRDNISVLW